MRQPSLELCGIGRWRVVDQPLTLVRGQASLPFLGCAVRGSVPAFVPVCGTRPHQIGDQPGNHFAEHSTRKTAISLAAFSTAAFGLPLFLWVEQTGEHASSGLLTHFRRGWCHTPFPLFNRSFCGVQDAQNQPLKWTAKVGWQRCCRHVAKGLVETLARCCFEVLTTWPPTLEPCCQQCCRSCCQPLPEAPLRRDVCHAFGLLSGRLTSAFCAVTSLAAVPAANLQTPGKGWKSPE